MHYVYARRRSDYRERLRDSLHLASLLKYERRKTTRVDKRKAHRCEREKKRKDGIGYKGAGGRGQYVIVGGGTGRFLQSKNSLDRYARMWLRGCLSHC